MTKKVDAGGAEIAFYGAAGTVTGSKYLLKTCGKQILIDSGLFQGIKNNRDRNWEEPPFDPASLDAVILTHAHIDHTGYLPVLVKRGFRGPVYATPATRELSTILLRDSGYLQEEEAEYLNKHKMARHTPALPLYTQKEAEASLRFFTDVPFETEVELGDGVRFHYTRAGHILGSACVHIECGGTSIVFSGDVGRPCDPVMKPPAHVDGADYLVCESTYGNRRHAQIDPSVALGDVIRRTAKRGGTVVIPSFAVGRAQSILHLISLLHEAKQIPDVPVYLNTPMGINATRIYCDHAGEHRLSEAQCQALFRVAEMVRSAQASKALNTNTGPAVIISASGMATGGRVVHHLKTLLPDPRNTVLFAGFQAPGTRGESLVHGAEEVKIHGQFVPVRAEIVTLGNLSAHADYVELLDWLGHFQKRPKRVFITHGEPAAADAFRAHIVNNLKWTCRVPEYKETATLSA